MSSNQNWKNILGKTSSCPDPDQLAEFVEAPSAFPNRTAIEKHIRKCSYCQAEMELLNSFLSAEPREEEEKDLEWIISKLEPVPSQKVSNQVVIPPGILERIGGFFSQFIRFPVYASALGAVIIILSVALLMRSAPEIAISPGGELEPPSILRGERVELISPVGDLEEIPSELIWEEAPDAGSYRIAIMEIDGNTLVEMNSTGPKSIVPVEMKELLTLGRPLLWQVTVLNTDGSPRSQSETIRIQLKIQR